MVGGITKDSALFPAGNMRFGVRKIGEYIVLVEMDAVPAGGKGQGSPAGRVASASDDVAATRLLHALKYPTGIKR